jgi:cell division protein FtsQ
MNLKSPLKKVLTVMMWCLLGGSALALLIAAMNHKNSSLCNGLAVEINGGKKAYFLDKKYVSQMLEAGGLDEWRHKKISSIDLQKLENSLRKSSWIRDVQLYFDNNQILKVRIQERVAAARILTVSGGSYLIDSNGIQLPLPPHNVFRLPVFTGYPEEKFGLHKDSLLDRQIRDLANYLGTDSFWSNQIQEVNIDPAKNFRMIPLIGNQVIEFGDGTGYENKFHRLFIFYKQVLIKTGFSKYTNIKLAFDGQIIATHSAGSMSRSDSIQALKNVQEMIRMAQKIQSDTEKIREVKPLEKNTLTEQSLNSYDLPEEHENQTEINSKHLKQK